MPAPWPLFTAPGARRESGVSAVLREIVHANEGKKEGASKIRLIETFQKMLLWQAADLMAGKC